MREQGGAGGQRACGRAQHACGRARSRRAPATDHAGAAAEREKASEGESGKMRGGRAASVKAGDAARRAALVTTQRVGAPSHPTPCPLQHAALGPARTHLSHSKPRRRRRLLPPARSPAAARRAAARARLSSPPKKRSRLAAARRGVAVSPGPIGARSGEQDARGPKGSCSYFAQTQMAREWPVGSPKDSYTYARAFAFARARSRLRAIAPAALAALPRAIQVGGRTGICRWDARGRRICRGDLSARRGAGV